jgi:hypothetical protein
MVDIFGEKIKTKICIYCKQEKPLSEFNLHPTRYDGHDGRCKCCIRKRVKLVNEIRKTAPPMPEACECCGKKPGEDKDYKNFKLCLDHDPETNTFRGWICGQCNTGIGLLGDNIPSIVKALEYLRGKLNA